MPLKQAAWRSTERTGGSENRASVAAKQPTRKGEGMCDQKKKKVKSTGTAATGSSQPRRWNR